MRRNLPIAKHPISIPAHREEPHPNLSFVEPDSERGNVCIDNSVALSFATCSKMGRFGRKKPEKAVVPANSPAPPPPAGGAPPLQGGMAPMHYAPPTPPWDATRFKIQLKMGKNRVEIQRGKKDNEIEGMCRTIAQHLATNKVTLARIQTERLLRETSQIRALDVVETMIELLANSKNAFSMHRTFDTLPGDVKEATATVIYAANILNVPELVTVVGMLRAQLGPGVVDPIIQLQGPYIVHINKTLASSLDSGTPDGYLVMEELSRIAAANGVDWVPPAEPERLDSHTPYRPPQNHHHPPSFPPPPSGFGGGGMGGMGGGAGGGGYPHMQAPAPQNWDYGGPCNIPGMPAPTGHMGGMPGMGGMHDLHGMPGMGHMPSAPPAPSAPPFDPGAHATGSLYPTPGGYPGHRGIDMDASAPPAPPGDGMAPSAPPPGPGEMGSDADFLSDEALEAKFRNVRDNHSRQ